MIKQVPIQRVLFFDVETVSGFPSFKEMPERMQNLWAKKHLQISKTDDELPEDTYTKSAAIYAEFGKIICISCGIWRDNVLRVKSFYGDNERDILNGFAALLNENYSIPERSFLCGHNIKEFDVPYVCRRMLVNGIELPGILDVGGKKPWEVNYLDTLQLWKFGDFKNYTSLDLLAAVFDIPTPKDDIDGSMVGQVYWQQNDIERIRQYCEKDVVTVVNLFRKLRNEPILPEDNVVSVK
jgi:3'-5' exonuclease